MVTCVDIFNTQSQEREDAINFNTEDVTEFWALFNRVHTKREPNVEEEDIDLVAFSRKINNYWNPAKKCSENEDDYMYFPEFEFRISTMTVAFDIMQKIDLAAFARHSRGISVIYDPKSIALTKCRKGTNVKSFRHQAELGIRYLGHRITCQLFQNGKGKLVGCKSDAEAEHLLGFIMKAIAKTKDPKTGRFVVKDPTALENVQHVYKVCLRKGDGKLPFPVRLADMKLALSKLKLETKYEPLRYSGLQVMVEASNKIITVAVFASGALQVAANVAEKELYDAFATVANACTSIQSGELF